MMPFAIVLPGPFELLLLAMFVTVPLTLIALVVFLIKQSNQQKK